MDRGVKDNSKKVEGLIDSINRIIDTADRYLRHGFLDDEAAIFATGKSAGFEFGDLKKTVIFMHNNQPLNLRAFVFAPTAQLLGA